MDGIKIQCIIKPKFKTSNYGALYSVPVIVTLSSIRMLIAGILLSQSLGIGNLPLFSLQRKFC